MRLNPAGICRPPTMNICSVGASLHVTRDHVIDGNASLTLISSSVLPPPQLSASSPSNDSIVVSWAPVTDAVQYCLSIYKVGSNSDMKQNTSDTNIMVSGLDAGSLYMISGFAWDLRGRQGEGSLYLNQTTRKEAPGHACLCLHVQPLQRGI